MGEMLKQVFMLMNVSFFFFAFKIKPATQESHPSDKHTETIYIQALSDVKKRSFSLNSMRFIGAQVPFPQRRGCFAHRKREKFYFFSGRRD